MGGPKLMGDPIIFTDESAALASASQATMWPAARAKEQGHGAWVVELLPDRLLLAEPRRKGECYA